ncbi:hypothetical protein BDR07DRAFT_1529864 [Suillus spraguei]|nr:hypothetical protein BDR07DRAFT_1529864 [Suillus spraguei]
MFSAASWWTLLALSITGSAVEIRNSRIILPMTSRLHFSNGTNPVQRNDAQWQDTGVTLEIVYMISCVSVGVGSPPTFYRLIVDTGSANTWIGAVTPYNPTDTAINTHIGMKRNYWWLLHRTQDNTILVADQQEALGLRQEERSQIDGGPDVDESKFNYGTSAGSAFCDPPARGCPTPTMTKTGPVVTPALRTD